MADLTDEFTLIIKFLAIQKYRLKMKTLHIHTECFKSMLWAELYPTPSPNLYSTPTPDPQPIHMVKPMCSQHFRMWLFGDRAFSEVIKLKWGL